MSTTELPTFTLAGLGREFASFTCVGAVLCTQYKQSFAAAW